MSEQRILDDFDVIRTREDLERHMTHNKGEPAWLLLSPTLLPGTFLVEQGRLSAGELAELCRAIEVQMDALSAGDAEGMVRSFFLLAPHMSSLFGRTLRDVADDVEKRVRQRAQEEQRCRGLQSAVRCAASKDAVRAYVLELTDTDVPPSTRRVEPDPGDPE